MAPPFVDGVPGDPAFAEYAQGLLQRLVKTTVASNALPLGDEHDFYKSYGAATKALAAHQAHLLSSIQTLVRSVQVEQSEGLDLLIHSGNGEDEVDERFEKLVEAVDALLERVVCC